MRLTFTKTKKNPTDQTYLQIQGRVTVREQFFKSSLTWFSKNYYLQSTQFHFLKFICLEFVRKRQL